MPAELRPRRRRRDVVGRCRGLGRGAGPDLSRNVDRALAAAALPAGPVSSARPRGAGDRRPAMIRAALSWALASRLWQGRTGAIRLLTGYRLCLSLFQGTR